MPYLSKEGVAEIRANLKKAFPGIKFSVRMNDNHSGVNVAVMQSPFNLPSYHQVNHYWIETAYYDDDVKEFFKKIVEIISPKGGGFYDGDYGYVPSYYVNLSIGQWNKPYTRK